MALAEDKLNPQKEKTRQEKVLRPQTAKVRISADVRSRLVEGEKILRVSRISPAIYWKSFAVVILALLFYIFIAAPLGTLLLIVSGIMALYAFALSRILLVVITNKRIMARGGLIKIDIVDLPFDKLESVELERMLPGYLFGYATLIIMGTGNRFIGVPYLANAVNLRRAYSEIGLKENVQKVELVEEKQKK